MSGQHAPFAPSAAHRWLVCPGSHELSKGLPNLSGDDALVGTLAHNLAAWCLNYNVPVAEYLGKAYSEDLRIWTAPAHEAELVVDDDMVEHVQEYVDTVRKLAEGHILLVEQRVQVLDDLVYGTGDVIIIRLDDSGEAIDLDLKYGVGVRVVAKGNKQIKTYGVGTLTTYDGLVASIKSVRGMIFQPRNGGWSEDVFTLEQLAAFKDELRAGVAAALAPNAPRVPGEEQCEFCPAKAICPELRERTYRTLAGQVNNNTPAAQLGHDLSQLPLVELWRNAIKLEASRRLLRGDPVDGHKLVLGRPGNRRVGNEADMVAALEAQGVEREEMFTKPELRSPSQLEDALRKRTKGAKRGTFAAIKKTLEQFLAPRTPGRPTVAPADDERPEYNPRPTAAGFSPVNTTKV